MLQRLLLRLSAHLDFFLLGLLLVLMGISAVVFYSASGQDLGKLAGHFANMAVALGVMWLCANLAPRHMMRVAPVVYALGLGLLIAVAFFGEASHGAQRWLPLGIARIQPAEIMKIAAPLMLAWY